MPNVLLNLSSGVIHRLKKMFYRPFSTFNIGWAKGKNFKTSDQTIQV